MKRWLLHWAVERPRTIFVFTVLFTLVLGLQILRIQVDTDPENMLPADQPDRVFHNLVEERFGFHDAIVVGIVNDTHAEGIYNVESLSRLHRLSRAILAIDGVIPPDLMSLAEADNISQAPGGAIRFEWMMKEAPATKAQALAIRTKVQRLPLLVNTLVSEDARAAAIYVPIESKDLSYSISMEIQALTEALGGDDAYHITGLPVAEDTFGVEMFIQMGISAPLAGLMIFLLMWYFFRSPRLVIAPMVVAVVTVIGTMGLLIGLGYTVHIMSSMIPIFLMPIAVVDSVHIMSEFADRYAPERDLKQTIRQVVGHLYTPMLFTTLTTGIGFGALVLTPIPPVQVFGAFVAIGVALAFLLTVLFIPAYVVRMKPASLKALARVKTAGIPDKPLSRGLRAGGRFAFNHGKLITGLALVVIAVSVAGVMRIQINDNPVRWFKEQHRIRVADRVLNEHFAGTYDAFLVLSYENRSDLDAYRDRALALIDRAEAKGADIGALRALITTAPADTGAWFDRIVSAADDVLYETQGEAQPVLEELLAVTEGAQTAAKYFQRPQALHAIDTLQQALLGTGWVGKTNALTDVVKVVNRELRSGEAGDYRIPDTVPAVAQTLLQYQSSHRPQDLWHMVTPDYRSTAIWLQLTSGDNQDMTRVIAAVDAYLAEHPLPTGVQAQWAGKTFINVVWQQAMVGGMLKSLLGAFATVFVMMALLFRSVRFGLLAMLPLSVTILAVYGLIGWIGKDYDMPIAVLSALTLGLSVDFAIHFLQRMRTLYRETSTFEEAAQRVFEEPARAISRNAIVIALGFTPLFLAPLVPYVTVGAFMVAIMAISGIATLVLLPAVMAWSHRALFKETALKKQKLKEKGLAVKGNKEKEAIAQATEPPAQQTGV